MAWGESPIEMQFDIRPLRAVYAAIVGCLVSLVFSILCLIAFRSVNLGGSSTDGAIEANLVDPEQSSASKRITMGDDCVGQKA